MLYIIGLGLNTKGISQEGLEAVGKADEVYLEGYTVNFPYNVEELEKVLGRKVKVLKREEVENEEIVKEAGKKDVALLVYGSPLSATTHLSLIQKCKKNKAEYKIIYAGSIFDAVAETGLSLYKFGKITSMPKWSEKHKPKSFVDVIKENLEIGAHSLLLIDIDLEFDEALEQLKETYKFGEIIVCSGLGTDKHKVFYGKPDELSKAVVEKPFCFIIPSELNFVEKEFLKSL